LHILFSIAICPVPTYIVVEVQMNNLKTILDDKGIKQSWIAGKLGRAESTVTRWVHGANIPESSLKALSLLLGAKVEQWQGNEADAV
jgi:ParB-like chromosome segregation protein Spo0J